jgi:hypothetical protein
MPAVLSLTRLLALTAACAKLKLVKKIAAKVVDRDRALMIKIILSVELQVEQHSLFRAFLGEIWEMGNHCQWQQEICKYQCHHWVKHSRRTMQTSRLASSGKAILYWLC